MRMYVIVGTCVFNLFAKGMLFTRPFRFKRILTIGYTLLSVVYCGVILDLGRLERAFLVGSC